MGGWKLAYLMPPKKIEVQTDPNWKCNEFGFRPFKENKRKAELLQQLRQKQNKRKMEESK